MSGPDLKTAAMKAWLYGLPLIEIAATRARGLSFGQSLNTIGHVRNLCLLYTSPSPRDKRQSRMPSSA